MPDRLMSERAMKAFECVARFALVFLIPFVFLAFLVIMIMFVADIAAKSDGTPDQSDRIGPQQVEEINNLIAPCAASIAKANAEIEAERTKVEQYAANLLARAAVIQAAIGEERVVATTPINGIKAGSYRPLVTVDDCDQFTGQVSTFTRDPKKVKFDFDGSAAQVIAYALEYGIVDNGWVNIAYGTEWRDLVFTTFRDAVMDPRVLATAGAAGRKILPILTEEEREQVRTLVIQVLAGVGTDDHVGFPLTVEHIRSFGDWARRTDAFKRDKLEPWESCAVEAESVPGTFRLITQGHYTGYNAEKCSEPPTPPKDLLISETGDWLLWEGDGQIESIFVRRWLQAGGGQKGDYLVWTYRVWATVCAHDLGLTSARTWAQEVRAEAHTVGDGFGKAQYLAFLDKVIAEQEAHLLDAEGLGHALLDEAAAPASAPTTP